MDSETGQYITGRPNDGSISKYVSRDASPGSIPPSLRPFARGNRGIENMVTTRATNGDRKLRSNTKSKKDIKKKQGFETAVPAPRAKRSSGSSSMTIVSKRISRIKARLLRIRIVKSHQKRGSGVRRRPFVRSPGPPPTSTIIPPPSELHYLPGTD